MPGGPSLYTSRMALALGARVTLVSRIVPGFDRSALAGIEVRGQPGVAGPRYANRYTPSGDRTQLLLGPGEPLDLSAVAAIPADAFILAPAFHECDALPQVSAPVVAVSLQGPLRTVDEAGLVSPHPDPLAQASPFVRDGVYAFFSEEDTNQPERLGRAIAGRGATAILTRGYRGAVVFRGKAETHLAAIPATAVDPTGAGDCFSTAFVVRMVETGDLDEACRFALAAGALAVEGHGIEGIPTRSQVEARLAKVAA